jgi:NADH:ubiquinone oxidoreductase subunit 2 (subunit N)
MLPITFLGLIAALVACIPDWNQNHSWLSDMMTVDNFSIAFTALMIVITILWFIMSPGFFHDESSRIDHFSLIIFALIGAQLMTSYSNLLMLFLAIEILSIPCTSWPVAGRMIFTAMKPRSSISSWAPSPRVSPFWNHADLRKQRII